jgi:hypothetical protein
MDGLHYWMKWGGIATFLRWESWVLVGVFREGGSCEENVNSQGWVGWEDGDGCEQWAMIVQIRKFPFVWNV